jgi:hypothetical protein
VTAEPKSRFSFRDDLRGAAIVIVVNVNEKISHFTNERNVNKHVSIECFIGIIRSVEKFANHNHNSCRKV